MTAVLLLEDGTLYEGNSFGAKGETLGEVVFNTCMTGYEEILTDPSYNGQIIAMTYPLIGNYGFNNIDEESEKPHVKGFIVREICEEPSNWRLKIKPEEYFINNNIIGIKDVDTRNLTKHIRSTKSMFGIISTQCFNKEILMDKLKLKKVEKVELVKEVSTKSSYLIEGGNKKIAIIDFGVKRNILRHLNERGLSLKVFPYNASPEEVLAWNPDGILLSNGPGNPEDLTEIISNVKKLLGKKPILGICLGHQLIGIAMGGKVYKLKFGHHGGNHPVKDLRTGRVYITSQNHNYALLDNSIKDIELTHININDNTVEGFRNEKLSVISVQYHPEAAPGPYDSNYIFDDFMKMIEVNLNA